MKNESYILIKNSVFLNMKNLIFSGDEGFHFRPMNNVSYDGIRVSFINMFNKTFINKLLKRKIPKKLEIYLRYLISLLDSEDDSETDITGLRSALNDLTRYRETVKSKYLMYLEENYAELLLQKIDMLEKELKNKIVYFTEKEKEEEIVEVRRR